MYDIRTAGGRGKATVRRVEHLPNGRWRADLVGGLVKLYNDDPRPFFARGVDAPVAHAPMFAASVCAGTGNHEGQPIDDCDECVPGDVWSANEGRGGPR